MNFKTRACIFGLALAFGTAAAQATSPPDSWTNLRVLECDGVQVTTYLAPPGFGTPFNVVGSTDVIIPMVVQVTFNGQTFTTRSVPGFDPNRKDVVYCEYLDPVGAFIQFLGIRK